MNTRYELSLTRPGQFDRWRSFAVRATAVGGISIAYLVVPSRYTHAHNGIINRADFDRTVDLVTALIQKLDAAQVARLRSFAPQP